MKRLHYPKLSMLWKQHKQSKYLLMMLLPVLAWYGVFQYGPMYGIQLAFKDFRIMDGIWNSPWVGWKHFQFMFSNSPHFVTVFKNTIIISALHIIFGFPAPIILALIFNELRSSVFKKITQTISYLPHFLSWIIMGGLLSAMLSPNSGIVNYIIQLFGYEPIYFLGDKSTFRLTLVVSALWKEVGWATIIYLAALAGVDQEQYEAAYIDGAGRWKQTLHVTIPGIMPVIAIMFILRIAGIMDAGFDQILNLYSPLVYEVSDIIDTYVYRVGLNGMEYSFNTAVGLFKNVIALVLVLGTNYLIKRSGQEGIV